MSTKPRGYRSTEERSVQQVHRYAYPIDTHLDSFNFSLLGGFNFEKGDWRATKNRFLLRLIWTIFPKGRNAPLFYHVSGQDIKRGGYGGACASAHGLFENLTWLPLGDPWKRWETHRRYVEELVHKSGVDYRLTRRPEEVYQAQREGKTSIILSIEGAHVLGRLGKRTRSLRLERLKLLGAAGLAYLTLNHYSNTDITEASYAALNPLRRTLGGRLSDYGSEFVHACIDAGILIDLTHTSSDGIKDVCNICVGRRVPAIVSHGASRSLNLASSGENPRRHKRALDDAALRNVIRTGGCISVILAPYFLQSERDHNGKWRKDANLAFIVEYYERLAAKIGDMNVVDDPWNHLSFGSDFDGGIASIPMGMSRGADLPNLTAAMINAGWPTERIKKVYSLNFLRSWSAAREFAIRGYT